MRLTSIVAIGAVAGATLVAGCGGGSLDATKVASAVKSAFDRFCARATWSWH